MFSQMTPRRYFSDGFERLVERLTERLPQGNIGLAVVAMNTVCYGLYWLCPPHNLYSYMNHFTFSSYGLSRGYFDSLLLCHFSHLNFLSYFLDSLIIGLFGWSLGQTFGNVFLAKGIVLSIVFGSSLLVLQNSMQGHVRPYAGNDAILRGLLFSLVFSNPAAKVTPWPIPFAVPAWAIGAILLSLDLLHMNMAGFGGVSAAYALVNLL